MEVAWLVSGRMTFLTPRMLALNSQAQSCPSLPSYWDYRRAPPRSTFQRSVRYGFGISALRCPSCTDPPSVLALPVGFATFHAKPTFTSPLSVNITEETLEQTHPEQACVWWRKQPSKDHGQRVYLPYLRTHQGTSESVQTEKKGDRAGEETRDRLTQIMLRGSVHGKT